MKLGKEGDPTSSAPGDLKNDNTLVVSSTPEGKTEQGAVLREEEVLLSSTDPGTELEKPEESALVPSALPQVVS